MIARIQPLAAGNALRIFLEVPADALKLRLLRKVSDTFTGQDDADALLVADEILPAPLDTTALVNGTLYHYRAYYLIGAAWVASATVASTPAAIYADQGGDVLSLLRDRLDLGLQAEVARGTLSHDQGHIKVLTAPPLESETVWPLVTVHLQNESPSERGIGEVLATDTFNEDTDSWGEAEGWLAGVQIIVMGWSLNPDERIELRKALRRIVVANLPVFDDAGMVEIQFAQQDTEDFGSYGAPVYQTLCTFSCTAPVLVGSDVAAINEVQVQTLVE